MTLGRQLLVGLSIIFALLVLGIETIFVHNAARTFNSSSMRMRRKPQLRSRFRWVRA